MLSRGGGGRDHQSRGYHMLSREAEIIREDRIHFMHVYKPNKQNLPQKQALTAIGGSVLPTICLDTCRMSF